MSANMPIVSNPTTKPLQESPPPPPNNVAPTAKPAASAPIEAESEPVIPNDPTSYFTGSVGPATPSFDQHDYGW